MNANEVQALSQSISFHQVVAIGGLAVLLSIARKMDLNHQKQKANNETTNPVRMIENSIEIQGVKENDPSFALDTDPEVIKNFLEESE